MLLDSTFGEAGKEVVIEQYLVGEEVRFNSSISPSVSGFCFSLQWWPGCSWDASCTRSQKVLFSELITDFYIYLFRALDGDEGLNTGWLIYIHLYLYTFKHERILTYLHTFILTYYRHISWFTYLLTNLNTDKWLTSGGMGAYAPTPVMSERLYQQCMQIVQVGKYNIATFKNMLISIQFVLFIIDELLNSILTLYQTTISCMAEEGRPFEGVLYAVCIYSIKI